MSEETAVLAEFTTEAEAVAALNRLQTEGIQGEVAGPGGELVPVAPFKILVSSVALERARQLLQQDVEATLPEGWEAAAETAVDGWICAQCDTTVPLDQAFCPECGASRSEVRVEDDEDEE